MNYIKEDSKDSEYLYYIIIHNRGIQIMQKEHTFEDTLREIREVSEQNDRDENMIKKEEYIELLFNSLSDSQWEALANVIDEDVPITIQEKSNFLYNKLMIT